MHLGARTTIWSAGLVLGGLGTVALGCGSRTGIDRLGRAGSDSGGSSGGGSGSSSGAQSSSSGGGSSGGDADCRSAPGLVVLASQQVGDVVHGAAFASAIAVDATSVYWANAAPGGSGAVMKVPLCGGTTTTLAESGPDGPALVGGIAVDAARVYWTSSGPSQMSASTDGVVAVLSVPLGGGTITTLTTLALGPGSNAIGFALGTAGVYWTSSAEVLSVALGGGAVTTLAPAPGVIGGVAVDSTSVYWT